MPSRFLILVLALIIDLVLGEPRRAAHPVVWIGKVIERFSWPGAGPPASQLTRGALRALLIVGGSGLLAALVQRLARALPTPFNTLVEAYVLKTTLSLRGLVDAAELMSSALLRSDLLAARREARALVSRDPGDLDHHQLASATVESVAENLSDSVVAPLLYYSIAGLPGAVIYRAVNTLDAMVGYHGELEHSGKLAARLDDALNLAPARISSSLIVLGSALAGGHVTGSMRALREDRNRTQSPNAGWPMSAMAGALGVRLEKPGHYVLAASLPKTDVAAIDHAVQIVIAATAMAIPLLFCICWARAVRR